MQSTILDQKGIYILGFCCDQGVERNKGRIGAFDGPAAIRKALCNVTTWHEVPNIYDCGDVVCKDISLEEAQIELGHMIDKIISRDRLPIVIGGGHETAWGSFLGIRESYGRKSRLGIINIDAHLDLRPLAPVANSGTPFRQMAIWSDTNDVDFEYLVLGIQQFSSSAALFEYADEKGVRIITADDFHTRPIRHTIDKLESFILDKEFIYLTIDLDAFDSAYAPGVSAPSSLGLIPQQIVPVLQCIANSQKICLIDICEYNPAYDDIGKTSRLAASLLMRLLANIQFL
jgi:formiminoglutamase